MSLAQCIGKTESTGAKKGVARAAAAVTKCQEKFDASCAKAEADNSDCSQLGTCAEISSRTCCTRKGWDGTIKGRIQ